ncbi:cytosine permease [Tissierella carlieri]|uniref:Cytosine permease n=1 Tax=Tissierella carlieri TaxID=689904 RepID=A0ABT1SBZ2_9FIRM|nr:cytosine permease [Tissierella carlieri]MCQ4924011.1 cytosine permease [Tissierella carlieri]
MTTNIQTHHTSQHDNATERVPENQKKGFFDVAIVAAGFCIAMSGLFTGASIAVGLDLKQAIIASFIGNTILSIYGGAVGAAGAKEGVATPMLARPGFGRQGSKVVSLVLALSMLGWFSVQVGFFGDTINAMFPNGGFLTTKYVAAFWGGILMLLTAYYGYKGISLLSKIAVPLIVITATIGMIVAVKQVGGWNVVASMKPEQSMGLGAGIVMVVGSFAGGASAQADITRYAKSTKVAWLGTIFGYMVANVFIIMAGFVTTVATGIGDLPSAMLQLGLGIPALLVLIGAQWTTNDNNLYTSSLGLANIINVDRSKIVLVSGVIATLVGVAGLSNYFADWLVLLGIGVPPMAGIILADYFFISNQKYEYGKGSEYCQWNINAFISWAIACLVGYFVNWGIASLNSLIVGMVVYIILMKMNKDKKIGLIGTYIEP